MNDPKKWIKDVLATPDGVRLYERERVLVDATEAICEVMQRLDVSRKGLADRLEVTQANVTQILSGRRNLTLGLLSDVFVALGRSLKIEHEPLSVAVRPPMPTRFAYVSAPANEWICPPGPPNPQPLSDGELAA